MNPILTQLQRIKTTDGAQQAKWVLILLVVLLGWVGARFFWQVSSLFSGNQISTTIINTNDFKATQNSNQAAQIIKLNLFGDAGQTEKVAIETPITETAPETRLNLKLRGIYASSDDKSSNAIIENSRGQQDLYFIDDKIPPERNLTLAKVLKHKVILNRNGKYETLTMEDFGSTVGGNEKSKPALLSMRGKKLPKKIDRRNNRQLTRQLAGIRQKMVNDPKSLAGLMNVNPVTENGQFKGFKISPGRDASLFARAGLRRNDLVTSINGIVLDDPTKILTLPDEIRNAQELSIEIIRGNQPLSLVFNLNDDKK